MGSPIKSLPAQLLSLIENTESLKIHADFNINHSDKVDQIIMLFKELIQTMQENEKPSVPSFGLENGGTTKASAPILSKSEPIKNNDEKDEEPELTGSNRYSSTHGKLCETTLDLGSLLTTNNTSKCIASLNSLILDLEKSCPSVLHLTLDCIPSNQNRWVADLDLSKQTFEGTGFILDLSDFKDDFEIDPKYQVLVTSAHCLRPYPELTNNKAYKCIKMKYANIDGITGSLSLDARNQFVCPHFVQNKPESEHDWAFIRVPKLKLKGFKLSKLELDQIQKFVSNEVVFDRRNPLAPLFVTLSKDTETRKYHYNYTPHGFDLQMSENRLCFSYLLELQPGQSGSPVILVKVDEQGPRHMIGVHSGRADLETTHPRICPFLHRNIIALVPQDWRLLVNSIAN